MYYATVMVLTTAATVLGVMVLRIHHQVSSYCPASAISLFSRNIQTNLEHFLS